ncbi:hypothetical protein HDV00_001002 [Rhizophlyctis rosea]|nr:hypothetical protein HDV00_001002 [Rhizophlyctis rosea]
MRGAAVLLGVDNWEEALNMHAANHPACLHKQMVLGKRTEKQLLDAIFEAVNGAGVTRADQIHIHASPPCQLITTLNAAHRDPEKGMTLVRWILKFLREVIPAEAARRRKVFKYTWTIEQVTHPKVTAILDKGAIFHNVVRMNEYGIRQTRCRSIGSNFDLMKCLPPPRPAKLALHYIKNHEGAKYQGNSNIYPKGWKEQLRNCQVRELARDISFTITSHFHWLISAERKLIRQFTPMENAALQTFPKDVRMKRGTFFGASGSAHHVDPVTELYIDLVTQLYIDPDTQLYINPITDVVTRFIPVGKLQPRSNTDHRPGGSFETKCQRFGS